MLPLAGAEIRLQDEESEAAKRRSRAGFTMLTIIRGDGTTSVFTIPDLGQDVTLRQMTVTGGVVSGTTPDSAGGIRHEGRVLTLTDCVITAKRAFIGGGLYAPSGSPLVRWT